MPIRRPPSKEPPLPAAVLNGDDPLTRGLIWAVPLSEGAGNRARVYGSAGLGAGAYTVAPLSYVANGPRGGKALSFPQFAQAMVLTTYSSTWSVGTVVWWAYPSSMSSGVVRAFFAYGNASSNELSAQIYSDNNWYVGWMNGGTDYRVTMASSGANYQVGVWTQYALTWDASGTKFWQNGNLIGSNATAPIAPTISFNPALGIQGTYNSPANYVGKGLLANFQAWNRSLRQSELRALYVDPWRLYARSRRRGLAPVVAGGTQAWMTQVAAEQWGDGGAAAQLTQIALEQWASAGVAAAAQQARVMILA